MQDLKTDTASTDKAIKDGGTWSLHYTGISCALISLYRSFLRFNIIPIYVEMFKPCSFFFMFEPLFQIMLLNKINTMQGKSRAFQSLTPSHIRV